MSDRLLENVVTRFQKLAMARDRQGFKRAIAEHLKGALGEYYKAQAGKKNGLLTYVEHWETEVTRLLAEFAEELGHSIRGFSDRGKVLQEAIHDIQLTDAQRRRSAEREVARDFKLPYLMAELDAQDTEQFWARARGVASLHGVLES